MTRIYVDTELSAGAEIELPADAVRHVASVLRLRRGDGITLFNGRGGEYAGTLTAVDRRHARVAVGAYCAYERESPLAITLAQGLSRGERMDFSIQKAVELGVSRIVPFQAARTNVKLSGDRAAKRLEHWRTIVISACEQCGRNTLPAVAPLSTLEQLLAGESYSAGLCLDPTGGADITALEPAAGPVLLVIGPEGGFEDSELHELDAAGCLRLALGPRILRTETATIAGLGLLQTHFGDFRSRPDAAITCADRPVR